MIWGISLQWKISYATQTVAPYFAERSGYRFIENDPIDFSIVSFNFSRGSKTYFTTYYLSWKIGCWHLTAYQPTTYKRSSVSHNLSHLTELCKIWRLSEDTAAVTYYLKLSSKSVIIFWKVVPCGCLLGIPSLNVLIFGRISWLKFVLREMWEKLEWRCLQIGISIVKCIFSIRPNGFSIYQADFNLCKLVCYCTFANVWGGG